jgi:hypothetical protein
MTASCLREGHGRRECGERRGEKDGGRYLNHCCDYMFVTREWRPAPMSKWNERRKSTAGEKKKQLASSWVLYLVREWRITASFDAPLQTRRLGRIRRKISIIDRHDRSYVIVAIDRLVNHSSLV